MRSHELMTREKLHREVCIYLIRTKSSFDDVVSLAPLANALVLYGNQTKNVIVTLPSSKMLLQNDVEGPSGLLAEFGEKVIA